MQNHYLNIFHSLGNNLGLPRFAGSAVSLSVVRIEVIEIKLYKILKRPEQSESSRQGE